MESELLWLFILGAWKACGIMLYSIYWQWGMK